MSTACLAVLIIPCIVRLYPLSKGKWPYKNVPLLQTETTLNQPQYVSTKHVLYNNIIIKRSITYSVKIERIEKIRKRFDLQKLTPTILNNIVYHIYAHAPEKINGKRTQQIDIYYDLIFANVVISNKS